MPNSYYLKLLYSSRMTILFIKLILIEIRLFSHTIHTDHTFFSLHFLFPSSFPLPQTHTLSLCFSLEKIRPLKDKNQTQQNKTQQEKAKVIIPRLDKATQQEEKKSQENAKESETHQLKLVGVPQNTKLARTCCRHM